ncbi:MAG: hypothetical protein KAT11_01140 [Phycisphaerae bacterium]|nr:hypothetical protein [Phycisphaerae bacterium]
MRHRPSSSRWYIGQPRAEPALGLIMTIALDATNDPALEIFQRRSRNKSQAEPAHKLLLAPAAVNTGPAALPQP